MKMKNLKLLLFALLLGGGTFVTKAFAEDHFLVGDATECGWTTDNMAYNRTPVAMVKVSDNKWVWAGEISNNGVFKIPNSATGWDGYWAPSANYALTSGVEADLSTNGSDDYKYCVAETGIYRVTINTSDNKIKVEKLTEPQQSGGYYLISSVDDYYWFAGKVTSAESSTAKARLTADLDFSTVGFFPLACDKYKFKGEFDGAGHIMKNMTLMGDNSNLGLIRYATGGAYIHDLFFGENSSFTGTAKIGGIIGFARDNGGEVKLTNVINKASVHSSGSTDANAAGLVGCATDNVKITALNCGNMGNVSGQNGQCAAFAGWTQSGTTFTNCWNSGTISNMENNCNLYRNTDSVTATNCYDASDTANKTQGTSVDYSTIASGTLCENLTSHTWNSWGFCTLCNEFNTTCLTPVDGYYEIGTTEQLNWFAYYVNNKDNKINGKLTNDIDFTSQSTMIGEPGHPYGGEFNGQGHTVTVAYSSLTDAGGSNSQEIEDNSELALFRRVNGGIIKNLKVAGTINTINKLAGGIVSSIWEKGTIENCVSSVVITDEKTADHDATHGGICARVKNRNGFVIIRNCAFVGEIQAAHTWGNGGIMGWPDNGGENVKIQNCYVSGTLNMYTDSNDNDVIVRNSGVATNCFYLNTIGVKNSKSATGVADMTALMNGLKPGWWKTSSETYPRPWVTSNETIPTSLSSVADVITFASSVACGNNAQNAFMTSDIDFTDIDYFSGIGTTTNRYRGVFDGNKYHIKNLTMNRASEDGVGFFSYVTSGGTVIKRFTIDNTCSFSGAAGVGAFVGRVQGRNGERDLLFEELGNEASVTASGKNAGAILGVDMNSDAIITVKNCYNTGTIIGQGGESGAFSGWFGDNLKMYNCYNIGTINDSQGSGLARANTSNDQVTCENTYVIQNNTGENHVVVEDGFVKNTTDFQNGTVFASLFAYNSNDVDGSVWRMDFDATTPHPVLYGDAIAMREDCENRMVEDGQYDVTMFRTVKTGGWNTVCLPFDMTSAQIESYFGTGTKVAKIDETKSGDGETIHFKSVTAIEAGQAYLVYPGVTADFTQKSLGTVTIAATAPSEGLTQAGFTFQGVFNPTPLTADSDRIVAGGTSIVKTSGGTLKGFRAYFKPESNNARATRFVIDEDETTGIITPEGEVIVDGPVYNLSGQKINQVRKGLYIVNGKKVIK